MQRRKRQSPLLRLSKAVVVLTATQMPALFTEPIACVARPRLHGRNESPITCTRPVNNAQFIFTGHPNGKQDAKSPTQSRRIVTLRECSIVVNENRSGLFMVFFLAAISTPWRKHTKRIPKPRSFIADSNEVELSLFQGWNTITFHVEFIRMAPRLANRAC